MKKIKIAKVISKSHILKNDKFYLEICDKLSAEEQNSLTHYLQELSEERIEQNEKLGIQIIPRKVELQRSFVHEMIPFIGLNPSIFENSFLIQRDDMSVKVLKSNFQVLDFWTML